MKITVRRVLLLSLSAVAFTLAAALQVSAMTPRAAKVLGDLSQCRNDPRRIYVHSTLHDSLKFDVASSRAKHSWTDVPTGFGEDIQLLVARIRATPPAVAALYSTPDGATATLRLSSSTLAADLSGVTRLPKMPHTGAGFTLGDAVSRVIGRFGLGVSTDNCGIKELAYAWAGAGTTGDDYIIYGYDHSGHLVRIEAGSASGGIRHLWEQK